ncbi:MAG: hypothetical protein CVV57_07475 [Tenericutes bacterium HGW-Tenericutes-2]|jgi:uncharacterized protein YdaT|nr:MAG: hypothetical protein CVV57_07475 [Tenericutes bacterium HGW-Tenericutes-2]
MCFFRKRRARKLAEKAKLAQVNQEKQEVKKVEVPKVEETKVQETKVQETKVEPVVAATEKPEANTNKQEKPKKYHVSQNKEEGTENFKKWRVRKEGSTKTIKFFDTQKDAIAYAEELAESAGSSVVIHKVDGSIRKQDYQKKE